MQPEEEVSYRPPDAKKTSRRRFIKLVLGLGGVVAAGAVASRFIFPSGQQDTDSITDGGDYLDVLNGSITSGGPPKDGIPSIDSPRFMSREEADSFLRPEDIVFGIVYQGVVRAYPQRILVWHEIVNDTFGGEEVSVTYCPLTGSQIAFLGRSTDGSPLTFGTTGSLVNSNLLMYDRPTDSNWPQILGIAINGSQRGKPLREVPLVWTTWEKWRSKHPDTEVLTTETGYIRNYSYDPYGSYVPNVGGYYLTDGLFFPVLNTSDRFPAKKVFFGLKLGTERLAIPLAEFRSVNVRNVSLASTPLVLLYDAELDTIRAFKSQVQGEALTFGLREGRIVDEETDSAWSPEGVAVEGAFQGTVLEQVNAFNVMWFAWYAFYPDTAVLL
ncbi:MAG: DUF3179 domain-containing protein [Thermoplasmata archaeon]